MTHPQVVYGTMNGTEPTGFSLYILRVCKPKGHDARALVQRVRRDPTFPRHIRQRDTWLFVLRYRPHWPWAERRCGREIWDRYAAWQRGQTKLAA